MGNICCGGSDTLDDLDKGRSRRCTDLLCLLLFLGSMGFIIAVSITAAVKEPNLLDDLLYPPDSYGNNCGKSGTAVASMGKVFYPQLDQDALSQIAIVAAGQWWLFKPTRMCASECPSGFSLSNPTSYGGAGYPVNNGGGSASTYWYAYQTQDVIDRCFPRDATSTTATIDLCSVPSCTNATLNASLSGSVSCVAIESQPDADNVWAVCPSGTSAALCTAQQNACELKVTQATVDTFAPSAQTSESEVYTRQFASYVQLVLGAFESCLAEDGYVAILLLGVAMPLVGGLAWMGFIYLFTGTFVYLAILLLILIEIILCAWLAYKAGWFDAAGLDLTQIVNISLTTTAEDDIKTWYTIGAVVAIILTLWHMIGMWLARRAITRLIAILKECTKVFKHMSLIFLWPIMSIVVQLLVFLGGMLAFYFCVYYWIGDDSIADWFGTVLVISEVAGIIWALEVVKGVVWMSMAGAVALWYVKDCGTDTGWCTFGGGCGRLCNSTVRSLTKHLGSVCFGALVITIVKMIRITFALLEYSVRDRIGSNLALKLLFKCINCILYCIEKTVEYVSLWGYIFVAVHGTSFCRSCWDAFAFQLKYLSQTVVNKSVQFILKLLIKITITVSCTLITFLYLDGKSSFTAKFNPLWPSLVVVFTSYIIAGAFCTIFDVSIDTIYLCAFEDMERVKANKEAKLYMSDNLRASFGIDKHVADEEADPSTRAALKDQAKRRGKVDPTADEPVA